MDFKLVTRISARSICDVLRCVLIFSVLPCNYLIGQFAEKAIEWDETTIVREINSIEKYANVVFKGKNVTLDTIRISGMNSTCGCLHVTLNKKIIPPGDTIEVAVKFNVTSSASRKINSVEIIQEDGKEHILTLDARLKRYVTVKPNLQYWFVNDEPQPKTVSLVFDKEISAADVEIVWDSEEVSLSFIRKKNTYLLEIAPVSTKKTGSSRVQIKYKTPDGKFRELKVFVAVYASTG
jgi:hypothetical protein